MEWYIILVLLLVIILVVFIAACAPKMIRHKSEYKRDLESHGNKKYLSKSKTRTQLKSIKNSKDAPKNITLITYGDKEYEKARERLKKEGEKSGWFKEVITHSHLTTKELRNKYSFFFKTIPGKPKRGGGYWLWKPYIISKELEKLTENDYLVYLDAGCTINEAGKERFLEYISMISPDSGKDLLTFKMDHHKEKIWTKNDLGILLDVTEKKEVWETGQVISGIILIRKTSGSVELIRKWMEVSEKDNFHYITDSLSKGGEKEYFKEHRHDQSVLSILTKLYDKSVIIEDETYPIERAKSMNWPFMATRKKD